MERAAHAPRTSPRDAAGGAASPAFAVDEQPRPADDPHLRPRGFFVELPHPEVGARQHIGIPWRLSARRCAVRRAAPCLGEDTDDVLRDVLGYDDERIAALRDAGVLT